MGRGSVTIFTTFQNGNILFGHTFVLRTQGADCSFSQNCLIQYKGSIFLKTFYLYLDMIGVKMHDVG
jgi:hypothetical protein